MRIAQIAPLFESVPPKYYGGTERIVSYLTEALVDMGHEVTLFASGDSRTRARLIPMVERSLRLDDSCIDQIVHHVLMAERVAQHAGEFEILHSHIDYFPFSTFRRLPVPAVTTLHGNLGKNDLVPLYREFDEVPLISISEAQRAPLPWVNWQGTVQHGLPVDLHSLQEGRGEYLAFLGRASPEKRLDLAIEVARQAGMFLKVAAKVDTKDQEYFETVIKPLLDPAVVEFVGEIGEEEKGDFLGNASALLFLIDWSEPFGLVMIEAMACGTPVIARPMGSVQEVIEDGVSGYIVDGLEGAVEAVKQVENISRRGCREAFERRFTARRMAEDYLKIFGRLVAQPAEREVA